MFDLTREPSKERRPHLESMCLPFCCNKCSKAEAAGAKKKFLVVPNSFTPYRMDFTKDLKGQPERQDILKKVRNSKASCYTLRKRITKLKCVNSEFRSVDIHPKQGCLNWPYGTMSESP